MAHAPRWTTPRRGGRPAGLLTRVAVGLVLAIFVGLLIAKSFETNPTAADHFALSSNGLLNEVTQVPMSVFNRVGVNAPNVQVDPPVYAAGQPRLRYDDKVGVFYEGNEYSPFAVAQKWALIVALSRFGTFTNLGNTTSSPTDYYPSSEGFTLWKVNYVSDYVALRAVERAANVLDAKGNWLSLTIPNAYDRALLAKYDTTRFFPQFHGQRSYDGTVPFVSIGNAYLAVGSLFTPGALTGHGRDDLASTLTDPTNDTTKAIVAAANYFSAAVCAVDGQQPSTVCASPGVTAAKRVMERHS